MKLRKELSCSKAYLGYSINIFIISENLSKVQFSILYERQKNKNKTKNRKNTGNDSWKLFPEVRRLKICFSLTLPQKRKHKKTRRQIPKEAKEENRISVDKP